MHEVLGDDLINTLPLGAPGLNRFDIGSFLKDKFWKEHESDSQYLHAYISASSIEKEIKIKKVKKMEKSSLIGEILAKRAKEKNISEVYFDRGEYKYHGRVKIFAETLRKHGLKF